MKCLFYGNWDYPCLLGLHPSCHTCHRLNFNDREGAAQTLNKLLEKEVILSRRSLIIEKLNELKGK